MLDLQNPCYTAPPGTCSSRSFELEAQSVASSLLHCKNLRFLDLSGNNFHATPIPAFFGSFKKLRYLSLKNANFSGKIPHNLGNITCLQHLDLRSNVLHADDVNWLSQLSSLEHLDMSDIYLGKAFNLFQVLVQLLYITHNELETPILEAFHNMTSIRELDLSYNNLV
ncbi:hypothetical protein L6164_016593 [Bauhinia variegata]|uniref:Uncharacterized protein n=1 Tax=Bauhinia variegata TaxID=167791 RepID=A0ACB9NQ08_BAUVA|nr:hypothetical protein L6164_016593 [Bauhinia variegata]